ncbi:DUF4913 domain-containing protein [Streptomyces capillispiralis]|uniref:DUF4913 domain-containing protein n=1 Tax=Streptomyces capillispiralis TaxID=68182 RepID=UPI0036B8184A
MADQPPSLISKLLSEQDGNRPSPEGTRTAPPPAPGPPEGPAHTGGSQRPLPRQEAGQPGTAVAHEPSDASRTPQAQGGTADAGAPREDGPDGGDTPRPGGEPEKDENQPGFILYLSGDAFFEALAGLKIWVHNLLLPVYGREVTSQAPWCPRWWEHLEAVAQLFGLWMAWQQHTRTEGGLAGPGIWHRDFLTPVMTSLRLPSGPFAGCKTGMHRVKQSPPVDPE